jgi:protein-tyrosine phosphatase
VFWRRPKQHRIHWLTDDIAIASEPSLDDWLGVREAGIRCVVDLREEMPDNANVVEALGLSYLRLPIVEGRAPTQAELIAATSWIDERISSEGPVLIHCREGRGRSATIAVATLVRLGIPLFEAYRIVMRARPETAINDAQQEALRLFAQQRDSLREADN